MNDMRYFRQALALMREERLYSAMYIAGTALAVAFVMLIAEVYYVKVADIAPEVNRSQTYYLEGLLQKGENVTGEVRHEEFRNLFQKMETPECVTAVSDFWETQSSYMKLSDGLHDRAVKVKLTEPGFFRLYQFHFIEGTSFTQDDFDNGRRQVVITEDISELLFGKGKKASGQKVSINNLDYRVCGVVETPSVLTERCAADIWGPYSTQEWSYGFNNFPVHVYFKVPADRHEAFMQEIKEVEARYNSTTYKNNQVDITANLNSHYSAVLENLTFVFDAWNKNVLWYVVPSILMLLLVPALNLSGMVASRMERLLPEMAIHKAFGAKRRTLLWQVIMENLILTIMGGVIGLCLAWTALYVWRDWVFYVFSEDFNLYGRVPIIHGEMLFGPAIFLIALLVCCVLNVLAAAVPAWLSLRKPIVESMMIKK